MKVNLYGSSKNRLELRLLIASFFTEWCKEYDLSETEESHLLHSIDVLTNMAAWLRSNEKLNATSFCIRDAADQVAAIGFDVSEDALLTKALLQVTSKNRNKLLELLDED